MIYQEVTFSKFVDAFENMGRKDNFTYEGKKALYDYLSEGEDFELDIIAICCEWTEYSTQEAIKAYGKPIKKIIEQKFSLPVENGNILLTE